ncbi:MAG: PEP-CTERM sorting domain-containing protein [Burkholderiaceae bacterium]
MSHTTLRALAGATILALSSAAGAADFLGNGDFQTGTFADWSHTRGVSIGHDGANDFAKFTLAGTLSQELDVEEGADYTLSFDLGLASLANGFTVKYDGQTLFTEASVAGLGVHTYSVDFVGADDGKLSFSFLGLGVAALDNVSVVEQAVAVPEPDSFAMMAAALGALGLAAARRRAKR